MLVGIFFLIVVSRKGPTNNRLPRNEGGGGAIEAFYRETVVSQVGETSFLWWTWRRQEKVNDSQSFFQVQDQGYIFQLVLLTHAWRKLWSFVLVSPVCCHINRIVSALFLTYILGTVFIFCGNRNPPRCLSLNSSSYQGPFLFQFLLYALL